jgi:CRP-like cAMP-binding protein
MSPDNAYLKNVDIFKNLTAEALEQIARIKTERKYAKNELITREGEVARDIWFVKSGRIRSVRYLSKGYELILTTIGPRIMFGACCSFSEGKYHCDHVADVESVMVRIPAEDLKALMWAHPEIAFSMIENLSSRLHLARRMQTVDHENLEKRLLHVLLLLRNEFGDTIPITRREIAEMAGTSVESCIRQMKKFERQKMIQSSRGKIVLKNLSGLIKL